MIPVLAAALVASTLSVTLTPPKKLDAAGNATYVVTVGNKTSSLIETRHLTVDVYFDKDTEFVSSDDLLKCQPYRLGTARCAIGFMLLEPNASRSFTVTVHPRREAVIYSSATLFETDREETVALHAFNTTFYRWFTVTSTADSGPGTLREAIGAINAECLNALIPCAIEFEVAGDRRVEPLTKLPVIVGNIVLVDGGEGMTIDGRAAGEAHGLVVAADRVEVRDMTIRGFSGIGLVALPAFKGGEVRIERNRVSGSLRGIMTFLMTGTISDNTLTDNQLSGIYITSGSHLTIRRNDIRGNGGAGVYLNRLVLITTIEENTIKNNRGYGIAMDESAASFVVLANSISGNALGGIDDGLDGPSVAPRPRPDPVIAFVVPPPVLTGATRSAETVITGTSCHPSQMQLCDVQFFASDSLEADGSAEGDVFLGRAPADGPGGRFTFRTSADLRGKYITAVTVMRYGYIGELESKQTSEFSAPLRVE